MTAAINSSWGATLPANPSLENLKKQAKSVLKAFRKGDESVCEILKSLPKFQDLSDPEILAGELCLRESQHALALNYGYRSWKELQEFVESSKKTGSGAESLVDAILRESIKSNASDIHFEWNDDSLHVRLRVDGNFRDSEINIPEGLQDQVIDNVKSLGKLKTEIKDQPQQGMASLKIDNSSIYLRISAIPYVAGESVVIRIWNDSSFTLDFNLLGFSEKEETTVRRWINEPNGIIVFTGPVGSGKTTSLYGVLSELDPAKLKIVTAEDPVVRPLKGFDQLQIDPSIGLTYERAIREQMNQDLDVMLVGECRKKEVADLICQVALTGHLVFTQMHSNNGAHAIGQLLHMGADSYSLSKTVIGVVSQRLVRKICTDCKEEYQPADWEREGLGIDKKTPLFRGKGCEKCQGTGYRGRIAVYELLEMNNDVRSAIVKDMPLDKLTEFAVKSGMKTLKQDGMEKALKGITTVDEVIRVCG